MMRGARNSGIDMKTESMWERLGGIGLGSLVPLGPAVPKHLLGAPLSNRARPPMTWQETAGVDIDAALSYKGSSPEFEVGAIWFGRDRAITLGYVQSSTIRRSVYNPLEPAHVKGIYSYADFGL